MAIGTGYAGIVTAPTNGLVVQGNVGIGTASPLNNLSISGDGGSNSGPAIFGISATNASSTGQFVWASSAIDSNLVANAAIVHLIGQTLSTGNSGYIGFHYVGAGSTGNRLTFGFFGNDNLMVLTNAGNVGIGTTSPSTALDVNGVLNANSLTFNRVPMPMTPGGRVTLSSSSPVMTADSSDVATIYYLPYTGQNVPIYDGTNWVQQDISSSGVSLTLSATNMPTTEVFDLYASMQSGSVTVCSLYWGGNTARSSTAGGKSGSQDARVVQQNGIWVNKTAVAASNCYNDATAYTFGAGQGTLLGTFYTDAAGKVSWTCNPAGAATGSNNILGIGNVYNQVPFNCTEINSTTNYTLVVTTPAGVWRQQDNSANTRVTYVDPLGYVGISASSANVTENITALTNFCNSGMCLNSTNCSPTTKAGHASTSTTNSFATDVAIGTFYMRWA